MLNVSVAVTVSIHVPTVAFVPAVTTPVEELMDTPESPVTEASEKVLMPVPVEVSEVNGDVVAEMPYVVKILLPPETTTSGLTVIVSVMYAFAPTESVTVTLSR